MTDATVLTDAFEINNPSKANEYFETEQNYDIEFEKQKAEQTAAGTLGRAFYGGGGGIKKPRRITPKRRKRSISRPRQPITNKRKKTPKSNRKSKRKPIQGSKPRKRISKPKKRKAVKRSSSKNKVKLTCHGGLF